MYQRKSRLTPHQQSRLIEHFVAGTTGRAASELIGVQANTSARPYNALVPVCVHQPIRVICRSE